jgi:hypothetical protein
MRKFMLAASALSAIILPILAGYYGGWSYCLIAIGADIAGFFYGVASCFYLFEQRPDLATALRLNGIIRGRIK